MRTSMWTAAMLSGFLFSGCAAATTSAPAVQGAPPVPVAARAYHGPKKTVAVARFDANGAFQARYGGSDLGGGLAAQLSRALASSDRVILVERPDLDAVLVEQRLATQGIAQRATPTPNRLLGAQLLIRGSVTEFEESERGGGLTIGGVFGGVGTALTPRGQQGRVAIDLRVIDTTTGRVVLAHRAEEKVSERSLGLQVTRANLSIGADGFERTALGQATRAAIDSGVREILAKLDTVPWQAQVIRVGSGALYVNAGTESGLKIGDTLRIYRVTDTIKDLVTDEVLGVEERTLGEVRIESVAPRYATASWAGTVPLRVGDLLRTAPTVAN